MSISMPCVAMRKEQVRTSVSIVPLPFSYRAALIILFVGSGLIPAMNFLNLRWSLGIPGIITDRATLLVCLPAFCIGIKDYLNYGGFAKSPPIVFTLVWIAATVLWVDPTERGRSLVCVVTLLVTIPICAFVRATDAFGKSARYFGISFLCGMIAVQLSSPVFVGRWGDFAVGDQVVMNSNEIGFICAIVAILIYAAWQEGFAASQKSSSHPWIFPAVCGTTACAFAAMTVSRSAGASLAVASFGIWFHHARRSVGMIIMTPILIGMLGVGIFTLGIADHWLERLNDSDTSTLNGRTEIWDAIAAVQRRLGLNCVWGLGCAGIDKALGEELGGVVHPIDGIQRMHSHNMYLELAVELGLVGIFLVGTLSISMLRAAMALGRRDNTPWRSLLLLCIAVFSAAGVPTKVGCFPAIGALVLAALSPATRRSADVDRRLSPHFKVGSRHAQRENYIRLRECR